MDLVWFTVSLRTASFSLKQWIICKMYNSSNKPTTKQNKTDRLCKIFEKPVYSYQWKVLETSNSRAKIRQSRRVLSKQFSRIRQYQSHAQTIPSRRLLWQIWHELGSDGLICPCTALWSVRLLGRSEPSFRYRTLITRLMESPGARERKRLSRCITVIG